MPTPLRDHEVLVLSESRAIGQLTGTVVSVAT
jgi:hypothetical protein